MNNYPVFARVKDYQCSIVSMGVGVAYGFTRKEEMKPVYIRQTSMAKFQDRLTAEVRTEMKKQQTCNDLISSIMKSIHF